MFALEILLPKKALCESLKNSQIPKTGEWICTMQGIDLECCDLCYLNLVVSMLKL